MQSKSKVRKVALEPVQLTAAQAAVTYETLQEMSNEEFAQLDLNGHIEGGNEQTILSYLLQNRYFVEKLFDLPDDFFMRLDFQVDSPCEEKWDGLLWWACKHLNTHGYQNEYLAQKILCLSDEWFEQFVIASSKLPGASLLQLAYLHLCYTKSRSLFNKIESALTSLKSKQPHLVEQYPISKELRENRSIGAIAYNRMRQNDEDVEYLLQYEDIIADLLQLSDEILIEILLHQVIFLEVEANHLEEDRIENLDPFVTLFEYAGLCYLTETNQDLFRKIASLDRWVVNQWGQTSSLQLVLIKMLHSNAGLDIVIKLVEEATEGMFFRFDACPDTIGWADYEECREDYTPATNWLYALSLCLNGEIDWKKIGCLITLGNNSFIDDNVLAAGIFCAYNRVSQRVENIRLIRNIIEELPFQCKYFAQVCRDISTLFLSSPGQTEDKKLKQLHRAMQYALLGRFSANVTGANTNELAQWQTILIQQLLHRRAPGLSANDTEQHVAEIESLIEAKLTLGIVNKEQAVSAIHSIMDAMSMMQLEGKSEPLSIHSKCG